MLPGFSGASTATVSSWKAISGPPAFSVILPPSNVVVCSGDANGRSSSESASTISVKFREASGKWIERKGRAGSRFA